MKALILGLGVIGTAYGYALQKAEIETKHLIRPEKRASCPDHLAVKLLDGRKNNRGASVQDRYAVALAEPGETFDVILVSVSSDKLQPALKTLSENGIGGTVLLMNGVMEDRRELEALMGGRPYLLGYPVAGGQIDMGKAELDCAMFDHIMLDGEEKAKAGNYRDIVRMFEQANIHAECPPDMLEWIWLHMAINAGVISTAAAQGDIRDSAAAARGLMDSVPALRKAIRCIRECVKVVGARGVNLGNYRGELLPYKLPSGLAAVMMRRMFRTNPLTRRIMELHANPQDLTYVCRSVYEEARSRGVVTPLFDKSYKVMMDKLGV